MRSSRRGPPCAFVVRVSCAAIACVCLGSYGSRAVVAEPPPWEKQYLAELRDAEERLRELRARRDAITQEITSGKSTRSREAIRADYDRVAAEIAEQQQRMAKATERRHQSFVDERKSRSVLFCGTATAVGVLNRLRNMFATAREPAPGAPELPELYYEMGACDVAIQKLIARKTEVAVLDRALRKEEEQALADAFGASGHRPVPRVFCKAAVALVVHRLNRVPSLTMGEAERVFRAEIDNWSALNSGPRAIRRVGTAYPLLSWEMFTAQVLKGKVVKFPDETPIDPNHPPKFDDLLKASRERASRFPGGGPFPQYREERKVIEEVSRDPGVIGYCLLMPSNEKPAGVRLLAIASEEGREAVPATREQVLSDAYPLQTAVSFLVRPDASEAAKALVQFACSKDAEKSLEQCGLFPATARQAMLAARRVEEHRAGKGIPVRVCGLAGREELARGLAVEYVKARALVQVKYEARATAEEAERAFSEAGELLIREVGSGQWAAGSEKTEGGGEKAESGKQVGSGQGAEGTRQRAESPHPRPLSQRERGARRPLTTHHSPPTTHNSPLTRLATARSG